MRVAIERITGRRLGRTDPKNVKRLRDALRSREKLPPVVLSPRPSRIKKPTARGAGASRVFVGVCGTRAATPIGRRRRGQPDNTAAL